MREKIYFMIAIFFAFSFSACTESTETTATETDSLTTTEEAAVTNKVETPALTGLSKENFDKLIGKWGYNHEPTFYEFKDDFTYKLGELSGENFETVTVIEEGTWTVKDDMVTFVSGDKNETLKLNFGEDLVYFGDLPQTYYPDDADGDPAYTNKEDFMLGMGYSKE